MYHGYLHLNVKTKRITGNFLTWHRKEYAKCILQHNNLVKCLGNKDSMIISCWEIQHTILFS